MKKLLILLTILTLLFTGCRSAAPMATETPTANDTQIQLSDNAITVNGKGITTDNTQAVYSAKDIVYYHAGQDFTYGEGQAEDTHDAKEADAHTVVHITKAGRYIVSGQLSLGQIAIDLGESAPTDPAAVVTLILNGVDITCTVAPAILFYRVYECGHADETTATEEVDTQNAGANVIVADGTTNNINGSYVAKIYKSYKLSEDGTKVESSETLHKYDGAFYAKQTMNLYGGDKGDGILNIKAENEGLDSEFHLTVYGGNIRITSGNDGMNANKDNLSVITINGGTLHILCDGSTGEGDGIDSNGWLVINGGAVTAQACAFGGDAGIDSDKGIYINKGKVVASGNMLDRIAGGNQTYAVFNFVNRQSGNKTYTLKNAAGTVTGEYTPANAFTYLIVADDLLTPGDYTLWQDTTQLSGAKAEAMTGNMPQGEMPETLTDAPPMPNGEMPQPPDGKRPQPPNGEATQMPDGERPQIPNGENPQPPAGEPIEMPNGTSQPEHTENTMEKNKLSHAEVSSTFTITNGANQFINVDTAK